MSEPINHLLLGDFSGRVMCQRQGYLDVTMQVREVTCEACIDLWREQDISRIMHEQNCSRKTAEYVHSGTQKLARRVDSSVAFKNHYPN